MDPLDLRAFISAARCPRSTAATSEGERGLADHGSERDRVPRGQTGELGDIGA